MNNANILSRRFTSDYSAEEHFAQNASGVVFTRMRSRGPFGYQNSAWRRTELAAVPGDARATDRKVRLPRAA